MTCKVRERPCDFFALALEVTRLIGLPFGFFAMNAARFPDSIEMRIVLPLQRYILLKAYEAVFIGSIINPSHEACVTNRRSDKAATAG